MTLLFETKFLLIEFEIHGCNSIVQLSFRWKMNIWHWTVTYSTIILTSCYTFVYFYSASNTYTRLELEMTAEHYTRTIWYIQVNLWMKTKLKNLLSFSIINRLFFVLVLKPSGITATCYRATIHFINFSMYENYITLMMFCILLHDQMFHFYISQLS